MSETEVNRGIKELSPIDVYMLLPKTNCKECGEENCMAFATKLVNREVSVEQCSPLLTKGYEKNYKKLKEMLKPAVSEFSIGTGERIVTVGGKLVMYRHEFTYFNPTAIAIDVTDEMPEDAPRPTNLKNSRLQLRKLPKTQICPLYYVLLIQRSLKEV